MPSQQSSLNAVTLLIATTALLFSTSLRAHTWTVGLAGGYVEEATVSTTTYDGNSTYDDRLAGVGVTSLYLLRRHDGHLGVIAHATYLPYGDEFSQAHHLPVGVGIRYVAVVGPDHTGSPYVEFSPALVWSNWKANLYGDYRESSIHPGMIAGLGVQGRIAGRIGLDAGLRYYLSANARARQIGALSQTLRGLRQAGILLGFTYLI